MKAFARFSRSSINQAATRSIKQSINQSIRSFASAKMSNSMTTPSPAMRAFINAPHDYNEDLSKKLPELTGNVINIITDEHQLVESLFESQYSIDR